MKAHTAKTTIEIADTLTALAGEVKILGLAVEGLLADQDVPEASMASRLRARGAHQRSEP